jgi:hypothetical protein
MNGATISGATTVNVSGGYSLAYSNAEDEAFSVSGASTGLVVTSSETDTTTDAITVTVGAGTLGTISLGDAGNGVDYETVNVVVAGAGSATLTEADADADQTDDGWAETTDSIVVTGTGDYELNIADALLGGNTTIGSVVAAVINGAGHSGSLTVDIGVMETEHVSAKNWTGVDVIKIETDDTGTVDNHLIDVASGTEIIIAGTEADDNTVTVDPNGTETGETLTVTLKHATAGSSIDIAGLTTDGFETLTINSTGTNTSSSTVSNVIDDVAGLTSDSRLIVTGDKAITLTGVEATFTNITVTNSVSSDITVDAGGALQYTGGSAADRLELDTVADVTAADSLNGGDGTDTLAISAELATDFTAAQRAVISNFEILEYEGAQDFSDDTGKAIDITGIVGLNTLKFASDVTTDNASTFTITASDGFKLIAGGIDAQTATTEFIISISGAADAGTSNTVYYDVLNVGAADDASSGFTIDNVENLVISMTGDGDADGDDTLTLADVDGAQLTSLTVTSTNTGTNALGVLDGSDDLIISALETTILSTLNASGMTGDFEITDESAFAATGATIRGGSAVDTITAGVGADTIYGNAGADVLKGAEGNDVIYGGAAGDNIEGEEGADTLYGEAGSDVFVYADGSSTEASMDIIKDFVAGPADGTFDTLDLVLAADTVFNTVALASAHDVSNHTTETETGTVAAYVTNGVIHLTGTQTSTVDTLAEWIDIAEDVAVNGYVDNAGTDAGGETVVVAFEFNGSTYVVMGDDGDSDDTYATEAVIMLEGVTGITAISTTEALNTIHVA